MNISIEQSHTFWQMKAFAIFTIFFAHMPGHSINDNDILVESFDAIGMFGVPLFFMISGFFNYKSKSNLFKTIKSLFVPLLIWGSICFILHIIKTPTDTIVIDWLKFILGSRSIYYFIPMLFCCVFLSKFINDWILIILGIVSQTLTTFTHVFPYNDVWTLFLNPLNFVIFFSSGRLISRYDLINRLNRVY